MPPNVFHGYCASKRVSWNLRPARTGCEEDGAEGSDARAQRRAWRSQPSRRVKRHSSGGQDALLGVALESGGCLGYRSVSSDAELDQFGHLDYFRVVQKFLE